MDDFQLNTPVAFFVFNRPDTTARVFKQIRQAKPSKLFVIADGPRATHPHDAAGCAATRAIVQQVDWDCECLFNYANGNMGCKVRMATGLDWVFSNVEEAIVLEHDTLPHPTFFRFCHDLLDQYRNDTRVMNISGCNFQFSRQQTNYSYYFSRFVHCWGWASWRRAWRHYDINMSLWPEVACNGYLTSILGHDLALTYWYKIFELTHLGFIDTWDYQWLFSCWSQNGLSILPHVNLVSNIGFDTQGTHTTNSSSRVANLATEPIKFPLKTPPFLLRNIAADDFTQQLYNTGEM